MLNYILPLLESHCICLQEMLPPLPQKHWLQLLIIKCSPIEYCLPLSSLQPIWQKYYSYTRVVLLFSMYIINCACTQNMHEHACVHVSPSIYRIADVKS